MGVKSLRENPKKDTAGLSTALRSSRDDNSVVANFVFSWKRGILSLNRIVISSGGVMGLRPTQGDEKRLGPASTFYATVTLSLSSRPKRTRISCIAALDKATCAPFS